MIPAERRQKMLEYISNNGSATITQLSKVYDVSDMTIHRDLHILETSGFIQKTYGGVIASPYKVETDFKRRSQANPDRKEKIGKAAASLVNNGNSILIDGSSTTHAIIPFLINDLQELTIFSTSVTAVYKLAAVSKFEIHATGGLVYNGTDGFVGPYANAFLDNIHVDICFIGASGICAPEGITDPIPLINDVKHHMAKASNEVIVCIDQTKFGRLSPFNILPLEQIDLVVTDAEEDNPYVQELQELGIEFLFC